MAQISPGLLPSERASAFANMILEETRTYNRSPLDPFLVIFGPNNHFTTKPSTGSNFSISTGYKMMTTKLMNILECLDKGKLGSDD
jgi:hypothetical protein